MGGPVLVIELAVIGDDTIFEAEHADYGDQKALLGWRTARRSS